MPKVSEPGLGAVHSRPPPAARRWYIMNRLGRWPHSGNEPSRAAKERNRGPFGISCPYATDQPSDAAGRPPVWPAQGLRLGVHNRGCAGAWSWAVRCGGLAPVRRPGDAGLDERRGLLRPAGRYRRGYAGRSDWAGHGLGALGFRRRRLRLRRLRRPGVCPLQWQGRPQARHLARADRRPTWVRSG